MRTAVVQNVSNRLHQQRLATKKQWILRSTTMRTWNAANVLQLWGEKESSYLLDTETHKETCVTVDMKEAGWTEVAHSDRGVECWSSVTRQLGAHLQLVCSTACSDIQGSCFIWQVLFVTSCHYCAACEGSWLSGQDEMTYGRTDWKWQPIVVT
jgi:hypothetical protein